MLSCCPVGADNGSAGHRLVTTISNPLSQLKQEVL